LLIPKGVRGILNYKEVTMTIENRSAEPIETVSEDYRHELDAKEEIARLVYNWRFSILGEYKTEWDKGSEYMRLSCLALAGRILEVVEADKNYLEWLEYNAPEYVWQRFKDKKDVRREAGK